MESKRLFDALANHVVNNPNQQFLSAKRRYCRTKTMATLYVSGSSSIVQQRESIADSARFTERR
jgi:hypothetical protein